jgi:hypothetical protein
MTLDEQFNMIEEAYYEANEENKETVLEAIKAVRASIVKHPELLAEFKQKVTKVCGGIYIPYLFWMELVKFIDGAPDRAMLYKIIEDFATSNFEEDERNKMKALLAVYFHKEKEFETSRIRNKIVANAHPEVQHYFNNLFKFAASNPSAVLAYYEKLLLLKPYYPNFELFRLPLPRLEEQLRG